jgi:hypothetical protein
MMREILETTEQLGQALQKKSQDIVNVVCLVRTTKVLLEEMRSDHGWETFFARLLSFSWIMTLMFQTWKGPSFCMVVQANEICKSVEKYYPMNFNEQAMIGLEHQLNHFMVDASSSEDMKKIKTLVQLCQSLVGTSRHRVFNLVDRLIWLLVTLPVSTATAERAFSILKITKTRLRNKMEDDFLANSLLVQIEGEIAGHYTYDDIFTDLKNLKKRRADL